MRDLLTDFKNFLMRGDVVVIAIGLIVATAFSTLIRSFTNNVITPIINRAGGKESVGGGIQLGAKGNPSTLINLGNFVGDIVYFIIFMAVVYFVIVVPFKHVSARRGVVVFGNPPPVKTCPACLSDDLPVAATKCRYCATELAAV